MAGIGTGIERGVGNFFRQRDARLQAGQRTRALAEEQRRFGQQEQRQMRMDAENQRRYEEQQSRQMRVDAENQRRFGVQQELLESQEQRRAMESAANLKEQKSRNRSLKLKSDEAAKLAELREKKIAFQKIESERVIEAAKVLAEPSPFSLSDATDSEIKEYDRTGKMPMREIQKRYLEKAQRAAAIYNSGGDGRAEVHPEDSTLRIFDENGQPQKMIRFDQMEEYGNSLMSQAAQMEKHLLDFEMSIRGGGGEYEADNQIVDGYVVDKNSGQARAIQGDGFGQRDGPRSIKRPKGIQVITDPRTGQRREVDFDADIKGQQGSAHNRGRLMLGASPPGFEGGEWSWPKSANMDTNRQMFTDLVLDAVIKSAITPTVWSDKHNAWIPGENLSEGEINSMLSELKPMLKSDRFKTELMTRTNSGMDASSAITSIAQDAANHYREYLGDQQEQERFGRRTNLSPNLWAAGEGDLTTLADASKAPSAFPAPEAIAAERESKIKPLVIELEESDLPLSVKLNHLAQQKVNNAITQDEYDMIKSYIAPMRDPAKPLGWEVLAKPGIFQGE